MLTVPVNADTIDNARKIAVNMAKAMGYARVQVQNVMPAGDIDVADAEVMLAAMRSWSVQMNVTR